MSDRPAEVDVSLVSHGQTGLALNLVRDLERVCGSTRLRVIITENMPGDASAVWTSSTLPIEVIANAAPKGFAANHNAAFRRSDAPFFCVVNPDIRIGSDPFPHLLRRLADPAIGVVAPAIVSSQGIPEDSARHVLTPGRLLRRCIQRRIEYPEPERGKTCIEPDWVAGMFMVFRSSVFDALGGFDAGYRMYCEDMELCCRLRLAGYRVVMDCGATAVHDAQRRSRRSIRHFAWHLSSIYRFYNSASYAQGVRLGPARRG